MRQQHILVVDDEPGIRQSLSGVLEDEGYAVDSADSGEACLAVLPGAGFELVLLDIWLPGLDGMETLARIQEMPFADRPVVVMISGHGSIDAAVKATKLGAFDFLEKPLSLDKVSVVVKNALAHRSLAIENSRLKADTGARYRIIGDSVPMKALRQQMSLMAGTNGRVLIYGESGTGKELVAHAIHSLSPRSGQPFVEVNCAAIPEELIESEMFGHSKGSLASAHETKVGKFQKADGGTLFLDEVGDMSLSAQAKVLRALQEGLISRVGSGKAVPVDVRVVAATNRDLQKLVDDVRFREDLWFRLNVIRLVLPPLRERRGDVPLLARFFVGKYNARYNRDAKLTDSGIKALEEHTWPGNVRQLQHLIERLTILAPNERIDGEAVRDALSAMEPRDHSVETLADAESEQIRKVLAATGGNKSRAAQILGIERKTLYRKLERMKL